ncbi:MAG TPA: glucosyl-3-phosphoglycerate synthase [Chloroflexota bacterium]
MNVLPLHVLVPEIGPASAQLLPYARCLLSVYGGVGTMLSVVEVPQDRSLSEGAIAARRRRGRLKKVAELQTEGNLRAEVRTAHSLETAIRGAVEDTDATLMLLRWKSARQLSGDGDVERLVSDPPCDIAMVKQGKNRSIETVLVPARGGPHARLALRMAEGIAAAHGAVLTLLHIEVSHWDADRQSRERQYFEIIRDGVQYENVRSVRVHADSVEHALLDEGARHDLTVMGASGRDETSSYLLGRIPTAVVQGLDSSVIIVKTREPVTGRLFGVPAALTAAENVDISELVDRWFAENTFHSREFRGLGYLVDLKERQDRTISLVLPTLNEEKTIGPIVSSIKRNLIERYPLIDEFLVIDSESEDRTVEIVTGLGVPVVKHPDILPHYGSFRGKGEALWKSLYATTGDIIVWVDSDITGFSPKFVYGLLGPLLMQPRLGFVKGFYRRPLNLGGQVSTTGGGRVTELTARPLINLFYPQLSGLVQPLAGEMAGRRDVLEAIPFFTGYGVETGLLIDILERFGLKCIAQTDLEVRVHRNQSLISLSKMAFAIVQVVIKRLGESRRLELMEDVSTSMKLIHYAPTELYLELQEVTERERPPMETVLEYRSRGGVGLVSAAAGTESGDVK